MNLSVPRRFTLLAEGTSDAALQPIILWLWEQHFPEDLVEFQFADLSAYGRPLRGVAERLPVAIDLFPCEILFIHRDSDKDPPENRQREIAAAIELLPPHCPKPHFIFVIPVKMSEAWMLCDEAAIRKAAGDPNGRMPLNLPARKKIESLPDPKKTLHELLTEAKGLGSQRKAAFRPHASALLVTGHCREFSALRQLSSFQHFEAQIVRMKTTL